MTESAVQRYRTTVRHLRREPLRAGFEHRSSMWVVDLAGDRHNAQLGSSNAQLGSSNAQLDPVEGGIRRGLARWALGSVQARDHLGDPNRTLRQNIEHFLALHDIELGDARVRLAAHPRALGFCFNPISVWWCTHPDGEPLATVVEVHNTYGDRHAYLLRPGEETVEKAMYVSPFHGVDGRYRVHAPQPEPGGPLNITVDLTTVEGQHFSASLHGVEVTGHALRTALDGVRDALLIRLHGVALWARRLPIRPRPLHSQEGVR